MLRWIVLIIALVFFLGCKTTQISVVARYQDGPASVELVMK